METLLEDYRTLLPPMLEAVLPAALCKELALRVPKEGRLEELRLRCDRRAGAVVSGENLPLEYVFARERADGLLLSLCSGALYAHEQTLREGFLTLSCGVRVGLAGRAMLRDGQVAGIDRLDGFVFRLPHPTPPIGAKICALLRRLSPTGVLLFAPPGVGKTTLLRGIAQQLSRGKDALRTVVIDTRAELAAGLSDVGLGLEILSGFPRGIGIASAVRTLSPQVLLCDEIGELGEAREILQASLCGVPLVASAHAKTLGELLARPAFALLHRAGCFGAYVSIRRRQGEAEFDYDITLQGEVGKDRTPTKNNPAVRGTKDA